jgi:hypothetical protein
MLPGDEIGPASLHPKHKPQCAKIAVVDQQIATLDVQLVQQGPFLRVAIFAAHHVVDDHPLGIEQYQRLTWQGSRRSVPQGSQTMLRFAQMVAIQNPHAETLQQRSTSTFAAIHQFADLLSRVLHQRPRSTTLDMTELVVQSPNRDGDLLALTDIRGVHRFGNPAYHLTRQIDQRREQQFPLVLRFRRLAKHGIDPCWSKDILHQGPMHHGRRARLNETIEQFAKDHPGRPP